MNQHQQIRHHLQQIELVLRETGLWQQCAPGQQALASQEPFGVDTMTPLQWLQWVLLPRMHQLLDGSGELPAKFAIAPYYETVLEENTPQRAQILYQLGLLDAQFAAYD